MFYDFKLCYATRFYATMHIIIRLIFAVIILSSNTTLANDIPSPPNQKKYVILSIDGGGVRGIVAARIIAEIEKRTGKQMQQMVDLISGNSTGGIIALSLVTPNSTAQSAQYSAMDLVHLYKERSKEIFPASYWWKTKTGGGLWGAKYDREGLDKILEEKFASHLLSKTLKPVIITSYSLARSEPHFWTTRLANTEGHKDFWIKDIAGATSAAPTYFEPKELYDSKGESCECESPAKRVASTKPVACFEADGGVFANNPSIIAVTEAYRANPTLRRKDIMLISVGTGNAALDKTMQKLKNSGVLGWVLNANLIDVMMNADSFLSEWESEVLGLDATRLQLDLDKGLGALDNISESNINNLLRTTERYIADNTALIDDICKKLLANMKL